MNPGARHLHPALLATLVVSLLASAWAWWWPSPPPPSAARAALPAPRVPSPTLSNAAQPAQAHGPGSPLPNESAEPEMFSAATSDPFQRSPLALVALPTESTQEHASAKQLPPRPPPAALAPAPPPMNHRWLGRFQSPEGKWLVLLQDAEQATPVSPGMVLSSGWVVEAVTAQAVQLLHPAGGQSVWLPMPESNAR